MNTLGSKLIALRKGKGLTQQELSEKINYSDKVISKWERGESIPNINVIANLAKFYNITIDELLQDTQIVAKESQSDENGELNTRQTKSNYIVHFFFAAIQLLILFLPFLCLTISNSGIGLFPLGNINIIINGYEVLFSLTPESFAFIILFISIWGIFLINLYFSIYYGVNGFSNKKLINYNNIEKMHKVLHLVMLVFTIVLIINMILIPIRIGYVLFVIESIATLYLFILNLKKTKKHRTFIEE